MHGRSQVYCAIKKKNKTLTIKIFFTISSEHNKTYLKDLVNENNLLNFDISFRYFSSMFF